MGHDGKAFKCGAAFAAFAMVFSSTAHAAPAAVHAIDPLVALSIFGTSSSRAAICAAGAASAAATAGAAATAAAVQAPPGAGCVLPVLDPAPPPVVHTPIVEPIATGPSLGILPIILGAAALAGLAWLLLRDDDDDEDVDIPDPDPDPVSP